MYMHHVIDGATLPEAYHNALCRLKRFGEVRPCPAYNTQEKSIPITIHVARPLARPRFSKFIPAGPEELQQYVMEMTDGILDFEARVTHNWAYTYHDRMIEQLISAVKILKKDPYSRRAVVLIRRPEDSELDDPPCLTMIQYLINDGYLDCFVTFRSNDAVKAFFMNAYALIEIQKIVAEILGVKVGHYVHTANSFHAYEKDWERLDKTVEQIEEAYKKHSDNIFISMLEAESSLSMDDDACIEFMNDSIPHIVDKVKRQMEKHNISNSGYFTGPLKDVILREIEDA